MFPKLMFKALAPSVMVSVCGALGGGQVARVGPLGRDKCLVKGTQANALVPLSWEDEARR